MSTLSEDISLFQRHADARGIVLMESTADTSLSENKLWRMCVSWGVNPMPLRLIAVENAGSGPVVVGASYFNPTGFLSALAVHPDYRRRGIGTLLICTTLSWMHRHHLSRCWLHTLPCDASVGLHALYTRLGFHGGDAKAGGDYVLSPIPENLDEMI